MNRYKLELEKLTVPESAVEGLEQRLTIPKKHPNLRPLAVAVAACLALTMGAMAVGYFSGWNVESLGHLPADEWIDLHGRVSNPELRQEMEESYHQHDVDEMEVINFTSDLLHAKVLTTESEERLFDILKSDKHQHWKNSMEEMEEELGIDLLAPAVEGLVTKGDLAPMFLVQGALGNAKVDPYVRVEGHYVIYGERASVWTEFCFSTKEGDECFNTIAYAEAKPLFEEYYIESLDETASVAWIEDSMGSQMFVLLTHEEVVYSIQILGGEGATKETLLALLDSLK